MATIKKKSLTIKKKVLAQKAPEFKSFRLSKEKNNFVTFKVTKQTLYWIILLVYILFLDVWIANAQMSAMVLLV